MAFKRLPNNYGTISKMSGKRRKPYMARKREGIIYDDETMTAKPNYVVIGYFETKEEALRSLAMYNAKDHEEKPTFAEVFALYREEFEKLKKTTMANNYISSFNKMTMLHNVPINEIKATDIELFYRKTEISRTMVRYCQLVLRGTFAYAVRHDWTDKNYAALVKVVTDNEVHLERKLFTKDEIDAVWQKDDVVSDIIKILLYTGMRVTELAILPVSAVHVEDGYLIGGIKTKAGKDRIIPLHDRIMPVIRKWYNDAMETKRERLLMTEFAHKVDDQWVRNKMKEIGHLPHDTRHTFVSQAHKCGMDEVALKRIIGHTLVDITEKVYTHFDVDELRKEVNKLEY